MSTSFIAHRSPDGSRLFAVLSLAALHSLTHAQIEALHALGITSLSDLLHYDPVHRARLVVAVANGRIAHDMDLAPLVRDGAFGGDPAALVLASPEVIDGIGAATARVLQDRFGVTTVAQLADFPPFVEAEAMMRDEAAAFSEPASAPDELIPRAVGAVVSKMRYSSFVREKTVALPQVNLIARVRKGSGIDERLVDVLEESDRLEIGIGYAVRHVQRWINVGTYLGEIIQSLAFAPGEPKNVAVIDWTQRLAARRGEATDVREGLNNLLVHTRALDEVTRAVAEEHQSGRTSTASATGVTAGGAVAAGAMVGAIGGAIVGGVAGLTLDLSSLGLTAGTATVAGTLAGSAVGALAGGAAGSLIMSGAGALGFIESDTQGDRDIVGTLQQNIMDVTSQKSSSIRSLRSTVVIETSQSEQEQVTTFNITNYNHSHALTIQYFEVLQRYRVQIAAEAVEPLLFLPFHPLDFTLELIADYWEFLKPGVRNKALADAFEQLIGQNGAVVLPDQPISQSDPTLKSLKITVTMAPVQTLVTEARLVTAQGTHQLTEDLSAASIGAAGILIGPPQITSTYTVTFSDADAPKLADVSGISLKLTGANIAITSFSVRVAEATMTGGGQPATLRSKSLGSQSLAVGASVDGRELFYTYDPLTQLQSAEQNAANELGTADAIVRYITARRYFFTRLLLASIEPEQVSDLLEALIFVPDGVARGVEFPLRDLVDTVPVGFTSGAIVLRMKRSAQAIETMHRLVPPPGVGFRTGAPSAGSGQPAPPTARSATGGRTGAGGMLTTPLAPLADTMRRLLVALRPLIEFPDVLVAWFAKERPSLVLNDEIALPTSGVFAEAILGRSNASEKIDVTRFFNWQDSPIPNSAPLIQAISTASRAQPPPPLDPNVPGSTLPVQAPTPLPDPTGLAAVLAAIQNGNIFRDQSQAAVLGSTLNSLAGVAERTAIAAGQLSGQALAEALQSATGLANTVAQGVQNLAGGAFTSLTQQGATKNQQPDPQKPDPQKPEPPKPKPKPDPPVTDEEARQQIDNGVREITFGLSPAELDQFLRSTTGSGASGQGVVTRPLSDGSTTQLLIGRVLLLGFAANRDDIDAASDSALRQLAALFNSTPNARVLIIGHADTTGSALSNQIVSNGRAIAAADRLRELGVDDNKILNAVGAGTTDLPVPTPANTPEALNRSVSVVFSLPVDEIAPNNVEPVPPPTVPPTTHWQIRLDYSGTLGGEVPASVVPGIAPMGINAAIIEIRTGSGPDAVTGEFVFVSLAFARLLAQNPEKPGILDQIKDFLQPPTVSVVKEVWKALWVSVQDGSAHFVDVTTTSAKTLDDFNRVEANMHIDVDRNDPQKATIHLNIHALEIDEAMGSYNIGSARFQGSDNIPGLLFAMPQFVKDQEP